MEMVPTILIGFSAVGIGVVGLGLCQLFMNTMNFIQDVKNMGYTLSNVRLRLDRIDKTLLEKKRK